MAKMVKAKIIRGVYVRGIPHAEDEIVELTPQEYDELRTANYVVAAPAEITAAPAPVTATDPKPKGKIQDKP